MTANYPQLVEMFRQSFAPVLTVGANRLALLQGELERAMAEKQWEQRRRAQLEDSMAGIRLQNELMAEREKTQSAAALEREKLQQDETSKRSTATIMATRRLAQEAELNRGAEAAADDLRSRVNSAIAAARTHSIRTKADPDKDPKGYVAEVEAGFAEIQDARNQQYDAIEGEFNKAYENVTKLGQDVPLTPAEVFDIAAGLAAQAVRDEKDKAAVAKMTAARDTNGLAAFAQQNSTTPNAVTDAVKNALALKKEERRQLQRAEELRMTTLSARLRSLEGKGATGSVRRKSAEGAAMLGLGGAQEGGEADELSSMQSAVAPAAGPAGRTGGLTSGLPNLGGGPAAPAVEAVPAADPGSTNWLAPAAAGAAALAVNRAPLTAVKDFAMRTPNLMRTMPTLTNRALGLGGRFAARQAMGAAGPAGMAALLGYTAGDVINYATDDAVPNWLARKAGGGNFDDALAEQRGRLEYLDQAARVAAGRGNVALAARLRAAKSLPSLDDESILRAVVGPGESYSLPSGTGMARGYMPKSLAGLGN